MKLQIYTDGGARGNPGPAAIGIVVKKETSLNAPGNDNTQIIFKSGKLIGEVTNNVAEYEAVKFALVWIKENLILKNENIEEINFYLDSNLVVQQLSGVFKVKDINLKNILVAVRILEQEVGGNIRYFYIPREKNQEADSMVNQALNQAGFYKKSYF